MFIFLLNFCQDYVWKWERKKWNLHISLVKAVARETVQHRSQKDQDHFKTLISLQRIAWARSGLESQWERGRIGSHTWCNLDEIRLLINVLVFKLVFYSLHCLNDSLEENTPFSQPHRYSQTQSLQTPLWNKPINERQPFLMYAEGFLRKCFYDFINTTWDFLSWPKEVSWPRWIGPEHFERKSFLFLSVAASPRVCSVRFLWLAYWWMASPSVVTTLWLINGRFMRKSNKNSSQRSLKPAFECETEFSTVNLISVLSDFLSSLFIH